MNIKEFDTLDPVYYFEGYEGTLDDMAKDYEGGYFDYDLDFKARVNEFLHQFNK